NTLSPSGGVGVTFDRTEYVLIKNVDYNTNMAAPLGDTFFVTLPYDKAVYDWLVVDRITGVFEIVECLDSARGESLIEFGGFLGVHVFEHDLGKNSTPRPTILPTLLLHLLFKLRILKSTVAGFFALPHVR